MNLGEQETKLIVARLPAKKSQTKVAKSFDSRRPKVAKKSLKVAQKSQNL